MNEILTASVFATALRYAAPYIFASIGETFAQRSGVLNLGVDGIMLMGAFCSFYAVRQTESVLFGLIIALLVGAIMGLLMAFVSVTLQAKQGIGGIGLYLFGLGFSELMFQVLVGTPETVPGVPELNIPGLSDAPIIGEIFLSQSLLVYVAFLLVPIAAFILNRTTFGLQIRAVGQNPEAADAVGVNVTLIRYMTVTIGGMLAGLAGATLSLVIAKGFQQNITAGMGFIAVALVYFGGWRPYSVMAGALLFSFVRALELQIGVIGSDIPSQIASMAPYIVTIIALIFASRRQEQPTALTDPFYRGE